MPPPLRAAVLGGALLTPLGTRVDAVVGRLLAGAQAATHNGQFPAETYPVRLAASLLDPPANSRHRKFLRRMALYALQVARPALEAACAQSPLALGILQGAPSSHGSSRLGLFFGYGGLRAPWMELMPAAVAQQPDLHDAYQRGLRHLHPFFMLQQLSNNAQALCAEDLMACGEGITLSGGSAGAAALAAATAALAVGAVDVALCVAYDSLVVPEVLIEQGLRGAFTQADDPALVVPPYHPAAAGAVPGEAAAALVLVRPEDALLPLCVLSVADAAGTCVEQTLLPGTDTFAHAIERVLPAQLASQLAFVDGAALAQPMLDAGERAALARMRQLSIDTPLIATQAALGQLGAAAPLVQVLVAAELLRVGVLPAIGGLASPAPGPFHPLTQRHPATTQSALLLSAGVPGLVSAVYLERTAPFLS